MMNSLTDVTSQRTVHARWFITRIRPLIAALTFVVVLLTLLIDPDDLQPTDIVAISAMLVATMIGWLASRRFEPLLITAWLLAFDIILLYCFVAWSPQPQVAVITLIWPLVGVAYFVSPRGALAASIAISTSTLMLARTLEAWEDPRAVPASLYIILFAGLLIVFVTRAGRRIEQTLELDRKRLARAVAVTSSLQASRDVHATLTGMARTMLRETCSTHALFVRFADSSSPAGDVVAESEHNSSFHLPTPLSLPDDLRRAAAHMVHAQFDGTRVITAPHESDAAAFFAAFQQCVSECDMEAAVFVPLALGDHALGFGVLGGPASSRWLDEAHALSMTVSASLSAVLAQSITMRDQHETLVALEHVGSMRERLIASVSHELRTPLTSTLGFIETLLREDVQLTAAERLALLDHARDGGYRLLTLVEDLLTLGASRSAALALEQHSLELSSLIDQAVRALDVPPDRAIRVEIDGSPVVSADRNRLLQVLENLVVNALRHGEGTIEIHAAAHDDNGFHTIDVLDEGTGIAEEHLSELFLPFARFSSRTDSTGLGLAICRAIIEAHGGHIYYARTADNRTRFQVRLPAATTSQID